MGLNSTLNSHGIIQSTLCDGLCFTEVSQNSIYRACLEEIDILNWFIDGNYNNYRLNQTNLLKFLERHEDNEDIYKNTHDIFSVDLLKQSGNSLMFCKNNYCNSIESTDLYNKFILPNLGLSLSQRNELILLQRKYSNYNLDVEANLEKSYEKMVIENTRVAEIKPENEILEPESASAVPPMVLYGLLILVAVFLLVAAYFLVKKSVNTEVPERSRTISKPNHRQDGEI